MVSEKNCVFIDEAGFNLYISRTKVWSKAGEPAEADVPKNKGTTITILGAISSQGVIDVSLRNPTFITGNKKRRANGKIVSTTAKIGTRTEHFLNYLGNIVDNLDKNGSSRYSIVIDNVPFNKPMAERGFVQKRSYRCVSPYPPFLNPIEEFWSKIKHGVKRRPFDGRGTLTSRIVETCSRCLDTEKNL